MKDASTIALVVVGLHLTLSLIAVLYLRKPGKVGRIQSGLFDTLNLSATVLASRLLVTGLFLYALTGGLWLLGFRALNYSRVALAVAAISGAVSLLLSLDAYSAEKTATAPNRKAGSPQSFWALLYTLGTERRAVSLLGLLMLACTLLGTYYLTRSLFTVEYQGAGIQIRLPGQTVHYLPLYPQISWQNTHILVEKGEKFEVEISGYVSPGIYGDMVRLQAALDRLMKESANSADIETNRLRLQDAAATLWPYASPAGYPSEWYEPGKKPEFLKRHPVYKTDHLYRFDRDLTVRGLTHCTVIGKIRAGGETEPRSAAPNQPGYDYQDNNDRKQLLVLSDKDYPITVEAPHSGELWVVINDSDLVRWDNAGMFMLKVTRHGWH